jgi:glutathione S-transferase
MPDLRLIIANKRFSSWSFRPWLALKQAGLPFEEVLVPLAAPDFAARVGSPTAKVPVLFDGDLCVHESLAICEYIAELSPGLWPADRADRARARAISAEMHAGFAHLRQHCSNDLLISVPNHAVDARTRADITRVDALIAEAIGRSGGPFLFGAFSIADAMYAPVACRFRTYHLPASAPTRAWMETVLDLPASRVWYADAQLEADWGEHP